MAFTRWFTKTKLNKISKKGLKNTSLRVAGVLAVYVVVLFIADASFSADLASYTFYRDSDGDKYGDPQGSIEMATALPPSGYVDNNKDCDDTNPAVYPGQVELCDNKDNDCDGNIDEEVGTTTYYYDGDGDGFGISTDTKLGCSKPVGYVATKGDCDDFNSDIYPGAPEICGDGIDQDCSGADLPCSSDPQCIQIEDVPLITQIKAAPPLIMFLLDDSGSMAFDVLCPENNGAFNGSKYIKDVATSWKSQYYAYNGVYYNPYNTYTPWVNKTDADTSFPKKHPLGSKKTNMGSTFVKIDGVSIRYTHWYMWSAIDNAPYLVILNGLPIYYKVTNYGAGDHGTVNALMRTASPPSDVLVQRAYNDELQNFVNWYQYYRNRELAAKASLARVVSSVKGVKIGIHTINGSVIEPVKSVGVVGDTDYKDYIIDRLYKVGARGGTPLRKGLQDVGQYFHGKESKIGPSPYASDFDGGSCQQAFVIMMTDGYYNGNSPNVGNMDGDNNTGFDGEQFGDSYQNTLADVAMYYYETDLSPLSDMVPPGNEYYDNASHQHMVTHSVSFGLKGSLTTTDDCPSISCPAWPNPNDGSDQKIDDLWHASVNGRGLYLSAKNTDELVTALSDLMADIQERLLTDTAVAIGTQSLETGTNMYQGFFNSKYWTGDLKAYDVKKTQLSDGSERVDVIESWNAEQKMPKWNSRKILSFNGSGGIPFKYESLTPIQQNLIDFDENKAKAIIDFIRGDQSNEKGNSGIYTFRQRNSVLGDIVNSTPVAHDGVVYVGANDGMLHAFNEKSGEELFGYIPSFVMEKLYHLSDTGYVHKYFVNATASAASDGGKSWLVGGLGKGGRGYYGIDITNASSISENNIPAVWEYPVAEDYDMGFSYSDPLIVGANNGKKVVIFGNGYDSKNGTAVLYVIDLADGSLIKKIDTGVGNAASLCNGLSTPVPIDVDFNGTVDYLYAGDLLGNLWKFDLRSTNIGDWGLSYYDGNNNKPLFQARDQNGNHQPITSRPAVMKHPDPDRGGFIVIFGTGRYLSFSDILSESTQAIYGIWDWAEMWEKSGEPVNDKYMGYQTTPNGSPAVRKLSEINNKSSIGALEDLTLLQQAQTELSAGWRETTNFPVDWFNPKSKKGRHLGWYFELPNLREKVIARAKILDGKAIVVSITPADSACSTGGESIVHIMGAANGGELDTPQFDTNDDGIIDDNDDTKTGKEYKDNIYYEPAIIEDTAILDKDENFKIQEETSGIYYWRFAD